MENLKIAPFINALLKNNASDLHLVAGDKPSIRIDGELVKLHYHELSGEEVEELCFPFLNEKQIKRLKSKVKLMGCSILVISEISF